MASSSQRSESPRGSRNSRATCCVCEIASAINADVSHAKAYEARFRNQLIEEQRRAPWTTHCGRDQPLDWHDPSGILAQIEDLRGQLRRQELLKRTVHDEAKRLAKVQARRDGLLNAARARARAHREEEAAIRKADPHFANWRASLLAAPRGDAAATARPLSSRRASSPPATAAGDGDRRRTVPTLHHEATLIAAPPPAATAQRARPWSASTRSAADIVQLLEPKSSPRPTSVMAHLKRIEPEAAMMTDWRSVPLPAPPVIVTPRPPGRRPSA